MAAKFKIQNPQKLLVPGLVVLLVAAAFLVGSLWTKVSLLEKTGVPIVQQAGGQPDGAAAQPDPLTPVKAETLNIPSVNDQDHIKGDKNAKLTWIEYSDLECPFCKTIHPSLQTMMTEYDGKVRWVYRHFPLEQLHPQARPAANAAECASSLGGNNAFWSFIDKMFEGSPTSLTSANYTTVAASVGANSASFKTCFDSKQFDNIVAAQLSGGEQAGVTGTPGSFLLDDKGNAWVVSGAVPYTTIKQIVDSALAL